MEMAPAIRDQLLPIAKKSVEQYIATIRAWWRLLDALEDADPAVPVVKSTAQLSDVHRQYAFDQNMPRAQFGNFMRLANTTRLALGLRKLYWHVPKDAEPVRHLPPQAQTDLLRHTLKHRWFATVRRWALADELRQHTKPFVSRDAAESIYNHQMLLLRNYQRFDEIVVAAGHPRPAMELLWGDLSRDDFYKAGYSVSCMVRGTYPDGDDIRGAFHLCLATTGWNPSVLLDLDVNEPFLEPHPKDPQRYILRGIKARGGGVEQLAEGLQKTQGGAGFILTELMKRTKPLREQLQRELSEFKSSLERDGKRPDDDDAARHHISTLEQGLRSTWLYVTTATSKIQWLTKSNYARSIEKETSSYLADIIHGLNALRPPNQRLSNITASDLRDAHATYVYRSTGGSVLAVMKALGHRRLSSTVGYLNNTLLKEEHRALFSTFSAALWNEMALHGRVDPTILAMRSRHGEVTPEQLNRLSTYRNLIVSRIGVGCKSPHYPPKRIAPNFEPDGKSMCPIQRCTLCLENAVILPESIRGLCKRLVELRHIRSTMGVGPFEESSFPDEIINTELALLAFDSTMVAQQLSEWSSRIENGMHRVAEFYSAENIL